MFDWLRRIVDFGGSGLSFAAVKNLYASGYDTGFVDGYERGFALYGVNVISSANMETALTEGKKQGAVNAEQAFREALAKAGPRTTMPRKTAQELYACAYSGGYASGSERGYSDASSGKHALRAVMRTVLQEGDQRGRARARGIFRRA